MHGEKHRGAGEEDVLRMVADVVAAYLSFNSLAATQIPELIQIVHQSFVEAQLGRPQTSANAAKPAVAVRRSVHDDYIVCLEDGKKLKMLKRYLRTKYNLTPDEYRNKWGLGPDYPMVAPNYSKQRSKFAKNIGLGRRRAAV